MMKKQNRDPNRSIGVKSSSSNKLGDKKLHNNSINTISSTIQYYPVQKQQKTRNSQQGARENKSSRVLAQRSKNSRILAQIKQSKQSILTKRQATGKSSNISTTRTNYKPKFILKQLMSENYNIEDDNEQQDEQLRQQNQQEQSEDESYSQERSSMCENYIFGKDRFESCEEVRGNNNGSDTFNNNSPLGSETFAKVINKSNNINRLGNENMPITNKSVMLSKRTQLQQQEATWRNTFHQADYDNIKSLNKPIQMGKMFNKKKQKTSQTEESLYQQKDMFSHDGEEQDENYQEASTVEYPLKLFSKQPRQQLKGNNHNNHQQESQQQDENYQFQSKLRSISSTNPCRPWQQQQNQKSHHQTRSVSPLQNPNYKTSYLETKKKLQIRSAYFNQAIELCKHIIGDMKEALGEEYGERKSERVLWCYERCEDVLGAFQAWMER